MPASRSKAAQGGDQAMRLLASGLGDAGAVEPIAAYKKRRGRPPTKELAIVSMVVVVIVLEAYERARIQRVGHIAAIRAASVAVSTLFPGLKPPSQTEVRRILAAMQPEKELQTVRVRLEFDSLATLVLTDLYPGKSLVTFTPFVGERIRPRKKAPRR